MTYEQDLIEFRAKVLMQAIVNEKPMTMELQNDYDFIMTYGSPELQEVIKSAMAIMSHCGYPALNERDKV